MDADRVTNLADWGLDTPHKIRDTFGWRKVGSSGREATREMNLYNNFEVIDAVVLGTI
jgi:hypothetical protein